MPSVAVRYATTLMIVGILAGALGAWRPPGPSADLRPAGRQAIAPSVRGAVRSRVIRIATDAAGAGAILIDLGYGWSPVLPGGGSTGGPVWVVRLWAPFRSCPVGTGGCEPLDALVEVLVDPRGTVVIFRVTTAPFPAAGLPDLEWVLGPGPAVGDRAA